MAVTISKEARVYAKENDLPLFQISLDLRHMTAVQKQVIRGKIFMGMSEMSGVCTIKGAKALFKVLQLLRDSECK